MASRRDPHHREPRRVRDLPDPIDLPPRHGDRLHQGRFVLPAQHREIDHGLLRVDRQVTFDREPDHVRKFVGVGGRKTDSLETRDRTIQREDALRRRRAGGHARPGRRPGERPPHRPGVGPIQFIRHSLEQRRDDPAWPARAHLGCAKHMVAQVDGERDATRHVENPVRRREFKDDATAMRPTSAIAHQVLGHGERTANRGFRPPLDLWNHRRGRPRGRLDRRATTVGTGRRR